MNEPFLGAVFDMDGTLIASEILYRTAWQRAAEELRVPLASEDYDRLMGLNRADTLHALTGLFRGAATAQAFLVSSERHYETIVRTHGHSVRAGIRELLQALTRRGVPLAVATSTHRSLAEETLRAVGLREFFSTVVAGDEVTHGKPDPEIYLRAAAALRIAPARCLAFEDSRVGAAAAGAAGMAVVLIPELSPVDGGGLTRLLPVTSHADALNFF